MGTISSGIGLVSGINTAELIDQLIAIESRPKQIVANQIAVYQAQQAAIQEINAKVLALKLTSNTLVATQTFSPTTATSSNESVFTASSGPTAVPGTYAMLVHRLVSTQQVITRGFADRDSTAIAPSGGTLTFEFGDARLDTDTALSLLNGGDGVPRGKIRITDRSGASAVVDLSTALTVQDVLDAINNATGVSVEASESGDGLVLTDLTGATTTALSVQDVGTTGTATALGLTATAVDGTLTGSQINYLGRNTPLSALNDGNGVRTVVGSDLRITRSDGSTADVDLSSATTIGDVLDALSAAFADVTASVGADGVSITLTDANPPGGGSLSVTALNSSKAAADLGIETSGSSSELTGSRVIATINSRLVSSLFGGSGATLDAISITNRAGVVSNFTLAGLDTIDQVIAHINANATGVVASLNRAGNGIVLTDTTGAQTSNLIVSGAGAEALNLDADVADGTIDSGNLQLRYISETTRLASLNGGAGVSRGKFTITDSSGASAVVDLTQGNETTIADVLAEINSRGLAINARINDNGDGILIEDTGPGIVALKVEEAGSTTARDLGLLGEAENPGDDLLGSFEKTITVAATDTLDDIITAINEAGLNVKATVINDGSADAPFRLSLLSTRSGRAGAFVFDDGGLGLGATMLTEGRDAVVFYGSDDPAKAIAVTSTTNTLNSLIPGATVNLKSASTSSTQLVIATNQDAVVESVRKLVTDANGVIDSLNKYDTYNTDTQQRGVLLGDPTVAAVRSAIYRLVNSSSSALTGRYTTLAQVGITVKSGKLTLNEEKLRSALATDPEAVADLFTFKETETDQTTGETKITAAGVGVRFDELLKSLTSNTGTIQSRIDAIDNQIELGNKRISQRDALLEAKRLRLQAQFAAMETALAQLQSQSSALTSLQNLAASISARK